jgi:fluoride exporter
MRQLLVVGFGGFIGSTVRYKLGGFVLHHAASWRFPVSTFTVNLTGCFIIGALAALAEQRDLFSSDMRLFLFTGLLGGYTTFSAFGLEGVYLLRRGELLVAALYMVLSVAGGFAAVWLGYTLFSGGTHKA